ncbi:MAG: OB-fold nucleic acid binding domain-containing protein, partial [Acidimicrobiia bacterium]
RGALWGAGGLRDARPDRLPGLATGLEAPRLAGMTRVEEAAADLWALGLSPGTHPTEFSREMLRNRGAVTVSTLPTLVHGSVVEVGGVVTHRQRPSTAKGIIFLSLEDETGLLNVICSKGVWRRYRPVARLAPAVVVRGVLERHQGVVTVVAQRFETLTTTLAPRSRDFR